MQKRILNLIAITVLGSLAAAQTAPAKAATGTTPTTASKKATTTKAPATAKPATKVAAKPGTAKPATKAAAKPAVTPAHSAKASTTPAQSKTASSSKAPSKMASPKPTGKTSTHAASPMAKPAKSSPKPALAAKPAPGTKTTAKASAAKPAAAKSAAASEFKPASSSSKGKRDPFVSPVRLAEDRMRTNPACSTGARCLVISQVLLKGTVKTQSGMIAMVENGAKKEYNLREKDTVINGFVLKITGDTIVFKETTFDSLGNPTSKEVVKRVTVPAV